jgi:signal transduction histidine kinase
MKLRIRIGSMTLRARLLSLTLSMVAIVALTLTSVALNSLTGNSLEIAAASSDFAGDQVQSFIRRHLSESSAVPPGPLSLEQTKEIWMDDVTHDADLADLLEQTMALSRSIVEINVAGEDGVILASSNPGKVKGRLNVKPDLHALLKQAGPLTRMIAILSSHEDWETLKQDLRIPGQKTPVFTIQVLVAPVLLRDVTLPALSDVAIGSSVALILAFLLAYWWSNIALRPLTRISHLIDDITSGKTPASLRTSADDARELAIIESKLSLLGERFRDAREDASQLRTNLEGVLEKLDAGTRQHIENQIALARRLTAINSLTGRVAHEIKNPLNSISLRLEMLRSRMADESPDAEPEFAILSEEVQRLDRVVRTFLDFNRPVELILEHVDIAESAAEILNLLEPEATQKGIELSLDRPPEAVVVNADRDLLRQALLNIAVNAIEAMTQGGKLGIEVEKNRDTCAVRIRDTGPGVPPEQRDKIFQLYFTTKIRGSGIGLAMTFRAVQLHGGTIEIESESGKGTAFRVTLPLAGVNRIG